MSSKFLAAGSWVMWFFSSWERKNSLQSWANSQNVNYFYSRDNLVQFLEIIIVLLWISSGLQAVLFFLNLRKITWLKSQQPKTRRHVELPRLTARVLRLANSKSSKLRLMAIDQRLDFELLLLAWAQNSAVSNGLIKINLIKISKHRQFHKILSRDWHLKRRKIENVKSRMYQRL